MNAGRRPVLAAAVAAAIGVEGRTGRRTENPQTQRLEKNAASKMDELLQREGLTEAALDGITQDFRAWRKARK
jgi:hypothetical protein